MTTHHGPLQAARLPRRLFGLSVDVAICVLPVGMMWRADVLSRAPFHPEPGWFYSEWWLKLWLDHPPLLTAPLLWWVIYALIWQLAWELTLGRTPGAWLVGITPLDVRTGEGIGRVQALGRCAGVAVNVATLGLGYMLCFIGREGRGFHELISRSVTSRAARRVDSDHEGAS